jgi:hypothetical protein
MNAFLQKVHWAARPSLWLAGVAMCLLAAGGCDLGLEESSNRYEQIGKETRQLAKILQQVTDEASAKQRLPEIQALGDKIRELQKKIIASEADNPMGMPKATNVRQANLFYQVAMSVSRNLERINQADEKAGEMINDALQDIYWQ